MNVWFTSRRFWRMSLAIAVVLLAIAWGANAYRLRSLLQFANRAADQGQWVESRRALDSFLYWNPGHAGARLLIARAIVSDGSQDVTDNAKSALTHLEAIEQTSPLYVEALVQRGRLHLLLLLQPGMAEACFTRALEVEPNLTEARQLMWKLCDVTGRWSHGLDHFWFRYQKSRPSERPVLLRDWYLSEFSPALACADLDRRWGFLGNDEQPSADTEVLRLNAFIQNDPTWPPSYARLALIALQRGVMNEAMEHLRRGEALPGADKDPSLIAARIAVSLERGELDEAVATMKRWAAPNGPDYEFLKTRAIVADEALQDRKSAIASYEVALSMQAGISDWTVRNRFARCLAKDGQIERANSEREATQRIERLMEPTLHIPLRRALIDPANPQTARLMIDFYQQLGRPKEVSAWKQFAHAVSVPDETEQRDRNPGP